MNWLIYIGGGWLWMSIFTVVWEKYRESLSYELDSNIVYKLYILASLCAWIWICLKFIRG